VYLTDLLIPCCRLLQDLHSLPNGCRSGHFVLAACWLNRYLADRHACFLLILCLSGSSKCWDDAQLVLFFC